MKAISLLLGLVALPISMYITHSILVSINADRLLMFLFWINLPVIFLMTILAELAKRETK